MNTNPWSGFWAIHGAWPLAQVFLFGEIFLKLDLGVIDSVLVWMPDEMFWLWISISRSDIGFTIDVNGFDLPIREIRQLFLDQIFEIVRREIGLNIFGDRVENLIEASEIGFIGLKFLN